MNFQDKLRLWESSGASRRCCSWRGCSVCSAGPSRRQCHRRQQPRPRLLRPVDAAGQLRSSRCAATRTRPDRHVPAASAAATCGPIWANHGSRPGGDRVGDGQARLHRGADALREVGGGEAGGVTGKVGVAVARDIAAGRADSRCSRRRPRSDRGRGRVRRASPAVPCQCGRIASPFPLSLAAMPPTPTLRWPPALGTYQL